MTWLPHSQGGWIVCCLLSAVTGYGLGVWREARRIRKELERGAARQGLFGTAPPLPPLKRPESQPNRDLN